jgi:hypothetical protein
MTINHILIFILVSFITTGVLALINRQLKKKAETSENQKSTGTELLIKRIIFLLLCFTLPVASVLMCFGYPLSYGLFSAYVGFHELNDYTKATEFWVALGIGVVGVDLIAVGLLKTLFKKNHS